MAFSRVTWRFLWLVISCDTQPFYSRISLAHLSRLNALRSVLVYLADCLPDLVALFFGTCQSTKNSNANFQGCLPEAVSQVVAIGRGRTDKLDALYNAIS